MLDLARDGLRLRPLVRTAPEAHGGLRTVGDVLSLPDRQEIPIGRGDESIGRGYRDPERADRAAARSEVDRLGGREGAQEPEGGSLAEPPVGEQTLIGIAGGKDVAVRRDQWQAADPRAPRVLELVDEHPAEALTERFAEVGMPGQDAAELEDQLVFIEHAEPEHDRVVAIEDLAELDLAQCHLAVGAAGRPPLGGAGPVAQLGRPDSLRLQRVDALEQTREQTRRIAADLVAAKGQLVEPVEQHGQPIRRPRQLEEGIDPGLERILAKQSLGEARPGLDPDLLGGTAEEFGDPLPEASAVGGRLREDGDPLRWRVGGGEQGDLASDQLGPARTRRATNERGPGRQAEGPLEAT